MGIILYAKHFITEKQDFISDELILETLQLWRTCLALGFAWEHLQVATSLQKCSESLLPAIFSLLEQTPPSTDLPIFVAMALNIISSSENMNIVSSALHFLASRTPTHTIMDAASHVVSNLLFSRLLESVRKLEFTVLPPKKPLLTHPLMRIPQCEMVLTQRKEQTCLLGFLRLLYNSVSSITPDTIALVNKALQALRRDETSLSGIALYLTRIESLLKFYMISLPCKVTKG